MAWIAWKKVCSTPKCGGLGIGSLRDCNLAMLTKWWWRFLHESNTLWKNVIISIHGQKGGLFSRILPTVSNSHWNAINTLQKPLSEININLQSIFVKRVGDGMSTLFWKDVWIGETPLFDRFPRLFALESLQDCRVSDRCSLGPFTRNWAWRRNVRSGSEESQLNNLLDLLKDFSPVPSPDSWTYCVDNTKSFTVSSMRKHIDNSLLSSQGSQIRWNKTIPIKVNIFSWRLCVDRLPTRCNLDKRGLDLDSVRCPMCNDDLETVQHVFVDCSVANYLWNMISVWWGFNNFPSTLANLISWSDTTNLSPSMKSCFDAGLSFDAPNASSIEENNALALAILPTDGASNGFTGSQAKDADLTGWELALVSTPSTDISSFQERQTEKTHVARAGGA
ncbi:RNA-directed DNA polymerase, eukaryota, reverse transcriptase zinc-binding domain protein [Tanacetum coccineum]